ncbi:unnamed protein product [Peronospora belbahrii]|uniref:Nucleotide-diphospho-sugar transferase domain-containing protein n=1 Tax=Peronospora belbahrii TaxID=622444 RepID=A0AAU9LEH9_9STRA|nr:unnamed protein product [Peronospora belbahrii]CAH0521938.1 unnamed protein product [Peronospora belbahrii]
MNHRAHSTELPTLARSGFRSSYSRLHGKFRQIPQSVLIVIVLVVLGLLVVTADFVFIWQATSGTEGQDHVAIFQENNRNPLGQKFDRIPLVDNPVISSRNMKHMEKQLVYTLHRIAQNTSEKRGIVLPMFDKIATWGVSQIMQLRAMNVALPVEVPHCGDWNVLRQRAVLEKEDLGIIRFYDVCLLAFETTSLLDSSRKVFCLNMKSCQKKYRSFNIKVLAVVFSQFEEIMLLDADTLLFESPMMLWETEKYCTTGTLFFHDRLSQENQYLGKRIGKNAHVSRLNRYISQFDVAYFAPLRNIERPKATSKNKIPVSLNNYSPSEHLLTSHSWNQRAGHEMDSSLVLWNKKRQPRATAILAAFMAGNGIRGPPSYGDKELFFIAAELAETQYAFSDFGVGSFGWDFRDNGPGKSVLCGCAMHYYPVKSMNTSDLVNTSLLYVNCEDPFVEDGFTKKPIYYTQARLYEVYAGSFKKHKLSQECPFDITGVRLTSAQEDLILMRQRFIKIAKAIMG